ncbi:MAG: helix-turn-helix domain-containing protein [Christensenellaceae bacterium]|nr:helix-turn-helix domain-containing protein [Christensenellaceae bacterium]
METLKSVAEKIAGQFETVTGIPTSIIDLGEGQAHDEFYDKGFCAVCKKFRGGSSIKADCPAMMEFSCRQSLQWGGKYESLCPISLAFISTLLFDQDVNLGLYFGPFLMMEPDDFITEDIVSHFSEDTREEVIKEVANIPYIEASKVSSYSDMMYIISSYATQRNALEINILERAYHNQRQQFDYITTEEDDRKKEYPMETENMLMKCISDGNRRGAQAELNKLMSRIFLNSGGDVRVVKVRVTELLGLLSRAAIRGGANTEQIFTMNEQYLSSLFDKKDLSELNEWLTDVLVTYTNCVFDSESGAHSEMILRVINYMRDNYMKKLRLDDIANYAGVSKSYISRIFKKEMGCHIIDYLNKIRVDNARVLILEKDMSIFDVSYVCGFEEQTYFSKVFKKYTGVSPGKFRDRGGKIR